MKDLFKELLETIALALLIFMALQATVRNYRVELSSMEATLFPKDRLVVNKLVYFHLDADLLDRMVPFVDIWEDGERLYPFHPPSRGDIVIFKFPRDPSRDFVKRVVGLPGETVSLEQGRVFIDGMPVDEPYLEERDDSNMPPTLVPPESYFVMGDNRDGSSDSRHWGTVPMENIVGKVALKYWPISEFSLLSDGSPEVLAGGSVVNPN